MTSIRKSLSFDDQCKRSAHQIQPNGKNLFGTPKHPERLHLRPWFYKYFSGEVFVDQLGVLSISTLLTISTPYIYLCFFQNKEMFAYRALCSNLTSMFFLSTTSYLKINILDFVSRLSSSKPPPATPLRRNILDCFIKVNEAWDWLLSHI